jgi:alginate O-acetyltransferase complex protein AlgI
MPFNSLGFIFVFLPVSLGLFYGFARLGRRPAEIALVLCSLVFFGWGQPGYVPLFLVSIAFNFAVGRWITRTSEQPNRQHLLLAAGIVCNLSLLVYFKYLFPFLAFLSSSNLIDFTPPPAVALPLGVSFFTITQIMFLLDCQQRAAREGDVLKYSMFVAFFPSLISGPILRHREVMPQLIGAEASRFTLENLTVGTTIFVLGLGKKVLLADFIGGFVDSDYLHPGTLGLVGAWSAVAAYPLQLYFDFSGYSDMAIGLARMLGIRLPPNFASPYKSASIIEFWQRWNMTLTRFLNLYLYNPIALRAARRQALAGAAGSRRAATSPRGFLSAIVAPTFVTMIAIGVWHGAGLQFVCFGLLHATYLTINQAWRRFGPKPQTSAADTGKVAAIVRQGASVLLTFFAVSIADVFFRAESIDVAVAVLGGMLGRHGIEQTAGAVLMNAVPMALLLGIVWIMPNTQQIMADYSPVLGSVKRPRWDLFTWRPRLAWAIGIGLIFVFAIEGLTQSRPFLYFEF